MKLGWLVLLAAGGCTATFAPPVRSAHQGAPAQLQGGDLELAGAIGNHSNGSVSASWASSEHLTLDLGGDWGDVWRMAYLGARLSEPELVWRLGGEVEAGAGGGSGGMKVCAKAEDPDDPDDPNDTVCRAPDARDWQDRKAYGSYVGAGLVYQGEWFRPFLKTRAQVTKSTGTPPTLWWSGILGPQAVIAEMLSFYLGVGGGGYTNRHEHKQALVLELGAAVRFH